MVRSWKLPILYVLILFQALPALSAGYYIVTPGDTVSHILHRAGLRPIYGKKGFLKEIGNLNSHLSEDINKIKPGQKIFFSDEMIVQAKNLGTIEIVKQNQIEFTEFLRKPAQTEEQLTKLPQSLAKGADIEESCNCNMDVANNQSTATSALGFKIGFEYMRIDAKDLVTQGETSILSNMNSKYEVFWLIDWKSKWQTEVKFSSMSLSIQPDISQSKTFQLQKPTLNEFSLGMKYRFSESFSSAISYVRSPALAVRATSISEISIDQLDTNKVNLDIEWAMVKHKGIEFGLGLATGYRTDAGSGSYKVNPSTDARVDLSIKHKGPSKLDVGAGIYYHKNNQRTDYSIQEHTSVGAYLGIGKEL